MFSTMDIRIGIVVQANPLVAPTSGSLLNLDYIPGSMMTKTTSAIESNTLKPNRDTAGQRRGRVEVSGEFKFRMKRDATTDVILSSAMGKKWPTTAAANDAIITGTDSVYMMIVQEFTDENGVVTRDQYLGCEVTKLAFDAANSEGIEATVSFKGLDAAQGIAGASTLTRVASSTSLELIGDDVVNMTVGSLTLDYTSLSLTIEQERNANYSLGTSAAKSLSASAPRKISGSLGYFRPSGALPAFTGVDQSFKFDLATAYKVELPAAYFDWPEDQFNNGSVEQKANFVAGYDNTLKAAAKIVRP